jgi:hypothetical protein
MRGLSAITLVLWLTDAVFLVMSLIGTLVFNAMLRLRLRTHHPDVWAQRGSGIALEASSGGLWSRVWARGYDDLADPVLVRLTSLQRICVGVFIGSVAVAAAAALVARFVHAGGN